MELIRTDLDQVLIEEQRLSMVSDDGGTQILIGMDENR